MDISKLCRSCMKEVASWEKENFDDRAVEMFCYCTNLTITDDNLPKQFCYDCIIKIESTYTFIINAQRLNITLKNMASRSTTVIMQPLSDLRTNKHSELINLTLPDYKICATINEYNKTAFEELPSDLDAPIDNIETNQVTEIVIPQSKNEKIVDADVNTTNIEVEKKNVCPVCRKAFTSKAWYSKHMQKEHSGHKYTCSHCPKTFNKLSQLTYHAASHSDERKFACSTCSKRFKRRKQLAIHARAHTDVRPFACDKCNMRFKLKSVLRCHMKVHDGEKQYLCSYCGWSFAQSGNLEVHMRKHTGEKPFACTECSFRAAVASNLRRHQRRHRAERPFVCKHCNKGFYDASGLTRHTRTHSGALPYSCPRCARAFADSWKRKAHLMRTHRLPLQHIPRMRRDGTDVDT